MKQNCISIFLLWIKKQQPQKAPEWSPLDICEAWALKRGYLTAKASRPDTYRAANELLRMALDGRLCLGLRPRGFSAELSSWESHEETLRLKAMIASVEAIAKEHKRHRASNSLDEEHATTDQDDDDHDDDDDDVDDELASDNYYRNYEPGSTDERDRYETNDTDADTSMANKFKVLASTDDLWTIDLVNQPS